MKTKNKLRVGVLIDGYSINRWEFELLEKIKKSKHSEIVLFIKNEATTNSKLSLNERFSRGVAQRRHLFYFIYMKLENIFFKKSLSLFDKIDIKNCIDTKIIHVKPIKTKFSDKFKVSDVNEIKKEKVDVFIRLGFRILRGSVLTEISKFGIWSFHHGDYKINRGSPAGFWEFLENDYVTGQVLQILTEELDNGLILNDSFSQTNTTSVNENKKNYYAKSSYIFDRVLSDLHSKGEELFFRDIKQKNTTPVFYSKQLYKYPSNYQFLQKIMLKLLDKFKIKFGYLFYFNQWVILFKFNNFSDNYSKSFYNFKKLIPPKDRFWADPFVVFNENRHYIFFEELIYKENKGKISCVEIDKNGFKSEPKVILEKKYHLSYPFIFKDHGRYFMIPESMDNKTIELYECESFPDKWNLVKVLLSDIEAVDSTILIYDNKYWLFTNIKEGSELSTNEDLFLFYADKLEGSWTPHPMNPIVSNISSSRPAGKIFKHKNILYRPSQNASKRYGYGMAINEIVTLNEYEYKEKVVQNILPEWEKNILATHTLNHEGSLTVIDGLIRRKK